MRFNEIIRIIAKEDNTHPETVVEEMNKAIHAAKSNPNFQQLFDGKEPDAEIFISRIAKLITETR